MKHRRQLLEYKGGRCSYCGDPVSALDARYGLADSLFEFHHVDPTAKDPDYRNIVRRQLHAGQLDELDKCVLLCARCHRIAHLQNIKGALRLSVRVAGKEYSEELEGLVIIDLVSNTSKFMTNELVQAVPYLVQLGDNSPVLMFGGELTREGGLRRYLLELPIHRSFSITRMSDFRPMFIARHKRGLTANVQWDVTFPLVAAEFADSEGKEGYVFLRRGIALTRDGDVISRGLIETEMRILE